MSLGRLLLGLICSFTVLGSSAQVRTGGGGSAPSGPRVPSTTAPSPTSQAVFIHGKVILEGSAAPAESVAIESVCNGAVRRQAYTDLKGNFEFQLGQNSTDRDATESGRDVFTNSGNRGPTQGMGSEFGINLPGKPGNTDSTRPELLGCELRASLAGFKTSSVPLRPDGSSWVLEVGTIVLTRMENIPGATISLTTMSAPPDARRAYEKGQRAVASGKFDDAERDLQKAVGQYPEFAAAWSLLGEVYRQQKKYDSAKQAYSQAIDADSQFLNPYYGMAILAVHESNWNEALKFTDDLLKLNPSVFPLAWLYNAAANYYLGNLDTAEKNARKFEQLDPQHHDLDSKLLLSNIMLGKHDYEAAAKALEEYLALAPNAPNTAQVKAQLHELNQRRAAADR
ncbi:MAG TPA: tetratricopeptide repeat protein [Candidatus Angelobacter sp.]